MRKGRSRVIPTDTGRSLELGHCTVGSTPKFGGSNDDDDDDDDGKVGFPLLEQEVLHFGTGRFQDVAGRLFQRLQLRADKDLGMASGVACERGAIGGFWVCPGPRGTSSCALLPTYARHVLAELSQCSWGLHVSVLDFPSRPSVRTRCGGCVLAAAWER